MTKKMSAFPSCPCPSSTHCGAIGRNLGRVPLCRRGRGRARAIGCLGVGRREGEKWLEPIVVARARSRSPALGARVHARDRAPEIARGRVFDLPHAPGNHLLLAHSLHRHGALDCCRSGVGGRAVSPRPRVAREARDIERASRFGRLRSPSSRSRRATRMSVSSARGLALARTGKRGAAGGDLARGHLGGGSDGEVGGDDGGHFCCCVVCVKRGVCANMTRGPRSPMALLGGGSFYLRLSDWPMWILSASSGSGVAKKRKNRSQNRRSRRETLFVPRAFLALNELCSCLFVLQTRSCLLYTSPSPRDATLSRMPSSA